MTVVQYLVDKCQACITTQDKDGDTPISDARKMKYVNILEFLKAHVLKMVMDIDQTILPFYKGVRSIIVTYLQ